MQFLFTCIIPVFNMMTVYFGGLLIYVYCIVYIVTAFWHDKL